jgi:6-pyruvoyltetrahydropterin/6-carboxytetrahydropterin synthase
MKKFEISCSHRLHNPYITEEENIKIFGKCHNEPSHGHNYIIEVHLRSKTLNNGMVVNFTKVKEVFNKEVNDLFDHQFLNNVMEGLPAAENMAKEIFHLMVRKIPQVYKIGIWETSTSYAEYENMESELNDE